MSDPKEILSEEEIKKKAYLTALRLKNTGLDPEAMYARLEKQGIPEAMARQVVKDIVQEHILRETKDVHTDAQASFTMLLVIAGLGVVLGLISIIVLPEHPVVPVGIIVTGLVGAYLAKTRMEK